MAGQFSAWLSRVALTPVIVLIGFRLPTLIGGSVIIEEVFQWPGLGKEFIAAVRGADYPLVMMIALFSVLAMLLASLIVDLLTALIDPRVRSGRGVGQWRNHRSIAASTASWPRRKRESCRPGAAAGPFENCSAIISPSSAF